ncbi:hypothetical protein AB0C34_17715 [Nocardia sp. NPDC049220]|uniref:hypothetical protein n=1 Tax=Nocardia sp. NPDC049220 TaxID=3155273 RepID=UPI0034082ED7
MTTIAPSAIAATIRTDELQAGDVVEHRRSGERFTVATVTKCVIDWRFHRPGAAAFESGMEIVGCDSDGERVRFTAAQSCPWWVIELNR